LVRAGTRLCIFCHMNNVNLTQILSEELQIFVINSYSFHITLAAQTLDNRGSTTLPFLSLHIYTHTPTATTITTVLRLLLLCGVCCSTGSVCLFFFFELFCVCVCVCVCVCYYSNHEKNKVSSSSKPAL
jgi:hypothetical protein